MNIVGSTWTFDIKRDMNKRILKFKARLVCAQGFTQVKGTDYYRKASHTIPLDVLRLFFAKCAIAGLEVTEGDYTTAYLNAGVDAEIYMRQPPGFLAVEGRVRALRTDYESVVRERDDLAHQRDAAMRQTRYWRRLSESSEEELLSALDTIATLSSELSQLRKVESERMRRDSVEARRIERERRYQAEMQAKNKKVERRTQKALEKRVEAAEKAVRDAEKRAAEADAEAEHAREEAANARELAMAEAASAKEARAAQSDAEYSKMLANRQATRAQKASRRAEERVRRVCPPTTARTAEEWLALTDSARRKARERDCSYLRGLFLSHRFRGEDVATVLADRDVNLLHKVMDSREGFDIYFERVKALMKRLEEQEFGLQFGLFWHYELRLTMAKIMSLVQAAGCKDYDRKTNSHRSKVLLYHPYRADLVVFVPRICPPKTKLYPLILRLQEQLGVQSNEEGNLAFRDLRTVLNDSLKDCGKQSVPQLVSFLAGSAAGLKLPIVIMLDATGNGNQQLNTIAIRNPYLSASSQQLRVFGLGNCSDDREGSTRLLGANLDYINALIADPTLRTPDGDVELDIMFSFDVAALRHCEHLASSGWCCCSRDAALRTTPKKPKTIAEFHNLMKQCRCPTETERFILSHSPIPGEMAPRPCTAPGCKFAHDANTALQELEALLQTERSFATVNTKAGKAAFSKWRMEHAKLHSNVQPGLYGRPMFHHDLDAQILDTLHLGALGLPKTPWKYGVLNNASDDARALISDKLKGWKHYLDTKRKDDNRVRQQKWFTGEKFSTFAAGERGSPGGPRAIAAIMKIIADDLQSRGVECGAGRREAEPLEALPALDVREGNSSAEAHLVKKKGRGKAVFVARAAAIKHTEGAPVVAERAQVDHVPTAVELAADPAALQTIRTLYGSRAHTIINTLLAFDAFFAWYYPFKQGVLFRCDYEQAEARAFDNCQRAIDLHEIYERVSIRSHGSFLPHGAIFKVSRDILRVGDADRCGTSPLELHNADAKRAAVSSGARNLTFTENQKRHKNATTMAISTLNNLLALQYLRKGDGTISLPDGRRKERLFGEGGTGRLTCAGGVKVEPEYDPRADTCINAFVRLLSEQTTT